MISEDTKALQCDSCGSDTAWKCIDCLNITGEMYDVLMADDGPELKWLCEGCDHSVTAQSRYDSHQNEKLDHLLAVIEKVLIRYEAIESKLENKSDIGDVKQLDLRIQYLEERMKRYDDDLECRFTALENQGLLSGNFETRLSSVENRFKPNLAIAVAEKENAISDEELIKCVVQESAVKQRRNVTWKKGGRTLLSTACQRRRRTVSQTGRQVMLVLSRISWTESST